MLWEAWFHRLDDLFMTLEPSKMLSSKGDEHAD